MNRKFLKILLLFLVLGTSMLFAQEEDLDFNESNYILKWEEVKGVKSYQLQIRDANKKLILDLKTGNTQYDLQKLEPGAYEQRLGVYNKFGKISDYSKWTRFTVTRVFAPVIDPDKKFNFKKDGSDSEVAIQGDHFYPYTKMSLKLNGQEPTLPILNYKVVDQNNISFQVDLRNAKIGDYDLILENPRNKKLEKKKFIRILEPGQDIAVLDPPAKKEEPEIPAKEDEKVPAKKDDRETPVSKEPTKDPAKTEIKTVSDYPYWKAGLRSALIPGWGQYYKDQSWKGLFFLGSLIIGAGFYSQEQTEFFRHKNEYNNSIRNGFILPIFFPNNETLYIYNITRNQITFAQAESDANSLQMLSTGLGVMYALNILDALFWKIPKKESAGSIQFYSNMKSYSIQSGPGITRGADMQIGVQIRF